MSSLTLPAGEVLHAEVPVEDHHGVVIDVQEGQLLVLLLQDHEDRVDEVDVLRGVEQPADAGELENRQVVKGAGSWAHRVGLTL